MKSLANVGIPTSSRDMKETAHQLRSVPPDVRQLERVLTLLAEGRNRELLVLLNEQPAHLGTLARSVREAPGVLRGRLLRLARAGLVSVGQMGRRRVYRLGRVVAVERQGRWVTMVVRPGRSKTTLRVAFKSRMHSRV